MTQQKKLILTKEDVQKIRKFGVSWNYAKRGCIEFVELYSKALPIGNKGGLEYRIAKKVIVVVANVLLERRDFGGGSRDRFDMRWVFARYITRPTEINDAVLEIREAEKMFSGSLDRLTDLATGIKSRHFS